MQQVGAVGSILYNGALSVYYLAVVTFNMKEKEIARKLEPWLHLIANGFAIGSGIFLAFKRQFAPLGNQIKCWVATYPFFCVRDNPDECVRGSPYTRLYANCLALLPSFITFVIACVVTMLMLYSIVKQQRKADRWRMKEQEESKSCTENIYACFRLKCERQKSEIELEKKSASSTPKLSMTPTKASKFAKMAKSLEHTSSPKSSLYTSTAGNAGLSRSGTKQGMTSILILKCCLLMDSFKLTVVRIDPLAFDVHKVRKKIRRESALASNEPIVLSNSTNPKSEKRLSTNTVSSQAPSAQENVNSDVAAARRQCLLYLSSFFLCWIFTAISVIWGIAVSPSPFPLVLLSQIFNPLQGLFFILVYSRPHVRSLRVQNPELSWFQAFKIAFKAGGDNDSGGQSNKSRLVIDENGIDAPRLPDAERQRRQEIVRQQYRKRNSSELIKRRTSNDIEALQDEDSIDKCSELSLEVESELVEISLSNDEKAVQDEDSIHNCSDFSLDDEANV